MYSHKTNCHRGFAIITIGDLEKSKEISTCVDVVFKSITSFRGSKFATEVSTLWHNLIYNIIIKIKRVVISCQRWSIAPSLRGDSLFYKAIVAIMHKINKIRAIIRNSDTVRCIVTSLEVINYRQRFYAPLAVNLIYNTIKRTIKTINIQNFISTYCCRFVLLFLFAGCAAKEYPPDLKGELKPINTNTSHKLLIEQQPNNKSDINVTDIPSIIK
jgi:hypothetical protein